MVIRVEHELHARRRGRNVGLGLVLVTLVSIVFGLTVVKVQSLDGNLGQVETSDLGSRPTPVTQGSGGE